MADRPTRGAGAPADGHDGPPPNKFTGSTGCILVLLVPALFVALVSGLIALTATREEPAVSQRATITAVETRRDEGRERPCYTVELRVEGELKQHETCEVNAGIRPGPAIDRRPKETREEEEERFRSTHPVGSEVKLLRGEKPPYAPRGAIGQTDVSISGGGPVLQVISAAVFLVASGFAVLLMATLVRQRR